MGAYIKNHWLLLFVVWIVLMSGAMPYASVITASDTSDGHEFFPLHVGDVWEYGYFCRYLRGENAGATRQEGILTRIIAHVDTISGRAYYITRDSATVSSLVGEFQNIVHANYRVDSDGNVHAYDPQRGMELLVFELNSETSDLWWESDEGGYGWISLGPEGRGQLFLKVHGTRSGIHGVVFLRRGIGMVEASSDGDLPDFSECGFHLLRAVISSQEHTFRPALEETGLPSASWGELKRLFVKP